MNHSIRRRLAMAMLGAALLGCLEAATRLWTGAAPRPEVRILPSAVVGRAGAEEGTWATARGGGGAGYGEITFPPNGYTMDANATITIKWESGREVQDGFSFYSVVIEPATGWGPTESITYDRSRTGMWTPPNVRHATFVMVEPGWYVVTLIPKGQGIPDFAPWDGAVFYVNPPAGYAPTPTPTPPSSPLDPAPKAIIVPQGGGAYACFDEQKVSFSSFGIKNEGTAPLIVYEASIGNHPAFLDITFPDALFPFTVCPGETVYLTPVVASLDFEVLLDLSPFAQGARFNVASNDYRIPFGPNIGSYYTGASWLIEQFSSCSDTPPDPTPAPPFECIQGNCDLAIDVADALYCSDLIPLLLGME
ncbi:MAG: hypothetical protein SF028_00335 [Candidatus Sumerlaeia bacterium]|nr:hypothetical protein [Candidatus Sumerlaeia bacterium]